MPIQPGTNIGRYHIQEKLGEGGMAIVYKAYDANLDCEVAIKTIRVERLIPAYREKSLKRFQIEARNMAKLEHSNIVKVIDFGEYEDIPYLVMPYIAADTLKKQITGPFHWQKACQIVEKLADALEYAHKKNIIHRDVKPSNVLMNETGQPLLSDFGIAKVFDNPDTMDLTTTLMGIGTVEYMAPEMATSRNFDHRADIYSLGILFYELLTGRKPFVADTPAAVLIKQASDPLPRPTQFNPNIPQEVEKVLLKALAKDPRDRFDTSGDFAEAIRKISLAGDGREPLPESRGMAMKSFFPILAIVGFALVLLGFGLNSVKVGNEQGVYDDVDVSIIVEATVGAIKTITLEPTKVNTPAGFQQNSVVSACEDQATFVSETISDGTIFQPGATFTKSWTLKNTGNCVWNTDYQLKFDNGDQLSGPDIVKIDQVINPGENLILEVDLKAPFSSGFFTGYWNFENPDNEIIGKVYVKITIPSSQKKYN